MMFFTLVGIVTVFVLLYVVGQVIYFMVFGEDGHTNDIKAGEMCRKHYFSTRPFKDCPDCGWSSGGVDTELR